MTTKTALVWLLRVSGLVLMSAFAAAMMPTGWMQAIHHFLLDEPLPESRIVPYLARSLSGLYGMLGIITWFLATDVRRYAPVVACKSIAGMIFGLGVLVLDVWIDLPWYWIVSEGPGVFVICCMGWWLSRRVGAYEN